MLIICKLSYPFHNFTCVKYIGCGGILFSLLIKRKTIVCHLLRNEAKVAFLSVKSCDNSKKVSKEINVNFKQHHIAYQETFNVQFSLKWYSNEV